MLMINLVVILGNFEDIVKIFRRNQRNFQNFPVVLIYSQIFQIS